MSLIPVQKKVSPCGKATLFMENDMSLGVLHDFLMFVKGEIVDMMIAAHKQEQAVSEAHKEQSCCEVIEDV